MRELTLNYRYAESFLDPDDLSAVAQEVAQAHSKLHEGTGAGSDFLGWLDLPISFDAAELARIKEAAERIQADSEVLIVIGIGGSYLGARAVIEALSHSFYNLLSTGARKTPRLLRRPCGE